MEIVEYKRVDADISFFVSSLKRNLFKRTFYVYKIFFENKTMFLELTPPLKLEKDVLQKIELFNYETILTSSIEDVNNLFDDYSKEMSCFKYLSEQLKDQILIPNIDCMKIKSAFLYEINWSKDIETIASDLSEISFEIIKFKANRDNLIKLTKLIRLLEERNISKKIRIDFNATLKVDDILQYSNADVFYSPIIDYIEQPVEEIAEITRLEKEKNLNIAIDESALSEKDLNFYLHNSINPIVSLKASLYGGADSIKKLYERIKQKNGRLILSSNFEGPIGFFYLLKCSSLVPDEIHGLDTIKYFEFSKEFYELIPSKGIIDLNKNYYEVINAKFEKIFWKRR